MRGAAFWQATGMQSAILSSIIGIALLQTRPVLPDFFIIAALLIFCIAGIFFFIKNQNQTVRYFLKILLCLIIGFCWAALFAHYRMEDSLDPALEAQDINISGIVAELPQILEDGQRFVFDVEKNEANKGKVPSKILISWYGRQDRTDNKAIAQVRPGERWHFTVRLKRPHGNYNPNGFDYEAWLLERGIRATGYVRPKGENHRLLPSSKHPKYLIQNLRSSIRENFHAALKDHQYRGILIALAIGDQQSIPNEQWTIFNRTGITHLVSISGLHITLIAAMFSFLANLAWRQSSRLMLRLPAQKFAILAGWSAAFTYSLLSGYAIPAQRTLYMLSVVAIALWSGKNIGTIKVLLFALLAVLLIDPWAILSVGFWLSFCTVSILLLVGHTRHLSEKGWLEQLKNWGIAQGAVTMLCIPLLLLFFQNVSLISPLANAVAIPAISFVVTPLSLLFSILPYPPIIELDHWILSGLLNIIDHLSALPNWQQASPPIWAVILAVIGIIWFWMPKGFPAKGIGIILLLPVIFYAPERPTQNEVWIDVLDVGQGLAVLIQTQNHNVLYDTGPSFNTNTNAAQRIIIPYLRSFNIKKLDALIVSHQDKDHSGGFESIMESLPVTQQLSSFAATEDETCLAGKEWEWDGISFSFLHPEEADYANTRKNSNHLSCVLKISSHKKSMLLTGDIETPQEKRLATNHSNALKSDILIAPHHGGKGSSSQDFVNAVRASDVIFSVGYLNSFKHPRPEILNRYSASKIWRTDHDGKIRVKLNEQVSVNSFRDQKQRYWHK